MKIQFFKNQQEFRNWLDENHETEKEIFVGFYKIQTKKPSITWSESVDQALCFGWIDGVRKRIDDESYQIRFTPRKVNSVWSNINLKKVKELSEKGQMKPKGLEIYNQRNPQKQGVYSFENEFIHLSPEFEQFFKKNEKAYQFFSKPNFFLQKNYAELDYGGKTRGY